MTYLALGDSYTIGECVENEASFPFQLVELLKTRFPDIKSPKVIATTGWTTKNLLDAIDEEGFSSIYDFVTLLIGVNNQYQGLSVNEYEKEFEKCLCSALRFANEKPEKVRVLSIPDYGITPFGAANALKIRNELDVFNLVGKAISKEYEVQFVDITPISRQAQSDLSLLASDELHPSGKMYKLWADAVFKTLV